MEPCFTNGYTNGFKKTNGFTKQSNGVSSSGSLQQPPKNTSNPAKVEALKMDVSTLLFVFIQGTYKL